MLDQKARVSAASGSVVLPAIQAEFGARLVLFSTLGAAVEEVLAGRSVAAIGDEVAAMRWLGANPAYGLTLELTTRPDRRPGLAMAMPWTADDLQAWLNLCIDKCALDGTLQALFAKHLAGVH